MILSAVYMLWMYQRVMYGEVTHAANRNLRDLSAREITLLAPLVLLMFWIGIYPSTFLRPTDAASAHLLEQVRSRAVLAAPVSAHAGGQTP